MTNSTIGHQAIKAMLSEHQADITKHLNLLTTAKTGYTLAPKYFVFREQTRKGRSVWTKVRSRSFLPPLFNTVICASDLLMSGIEQEIASGHQTPGNTILAVLYQGPEDSLKTYRVFLRHSDGAKQIHSVLNGNWADQQNPDNPADKSDPKAVQEADKERLFFNKPFVDVHTAEYISEVHNALTSAGANDVTPESAAAFILTLANTPAACQQLGLQIAVGSHAVLHEAEQLLAHQDAALADGAAQHQKAVTLAQLSLDKAHKRFAAEHEKQANLLRQANERIARLSSDLQASKQAQAPVVAVGTAALGKKLDEIFA